MYQENISQLLMNISPGGFVPTTEAPVPLTSLHIALPWAHVKRPGNVAKMIQHPWIFPSNASSMWNVVRQEYFSKARDSHCDCEHWFTFSIVFPSFSFFFVFHPFRSFSCSKGFCFPLQFFWPQGSGSMPFSCYLLWCSRPFQSTASVWALWWVRCSAPWGSGQRWSNWRRSAKGGWMLPAMQSWWRTGPCHGKRISGWL